LTIAGAAVALVAFITLRTVLYAWNVGADHAPQDRLMFRHKLPSHCNCRSTMPIAYAASGV
jgi:hypothetical protein